MKYTYNSVRSICMVIVYLFFVVLPLLCLLFLHYCGLHIDIYTLLAVDYDVVEAD